MPVVGKIFVVLPAYNEEASLRRLLPDIASVLAPLGIPWEILVVNDGSNDATVPLIDTLSSSVPVRLLTHEKNLGYGAALATGFRWTVQHGGDGDAAVSLDADRTHGPDSIPVMLRKLDEGYDIVTASYVLPGGAVSGVPPLRRWMSAVVNRFFRFVRPAPGVGTYTNGFRAYRVAVLKRVGERFGQVLIEESGFPGGVELFLKACAAGGRAAEIPFHLHYENRGDASKIRLLRTIGLYLRLLWKARRIRSL